MTKKLLLSLALILGMSTATVQAAEHYTVDTKGMHAFVTFKIKHLGYSWLQGRFDKFAGEFDYDEANTANNKVSMTIDIMSLNSNHAERDKHLRSDDFFNAKKFPQATFVSTSWQDKEKGTAVLTGQFTLHGVSKEISFDVTQIGGGKDPWGGFRRGFEASTTINVADYDMKSPGGSGDVQLWIAIEGVRN